MKFYTIDEALEILDKYGITDSKQMIYRWINKKLIKTDKEKNKHKISEKELLEFIEQRKPRIIEIHENVDDLIKKFDELSLKVISLEGKLTSFLELQTRQKSWEDKIENIIIEIKNKQNCFSEEEKKETLIIMKELKNEVVRLVETSNNKRKAQSNRNAVPGQMEFQYEEEFVDENNFEFEDSEIIQAMKEKIKDDVYQKYQNEIYDGIVKTLTRRVNEWHFPTQEKKYRCLYTKKEYSKKIPFLKIFIEHYIIGFLREKDKKK